MNFEKVTIKKAFEFIIGKPGKKIEKNMITLIRNHFFSTQLEYL